MLKKTAEFLLFGNYYLALCIVASCAETLVRLGLQPAGYGFLTIIFFATVVYYTHAYIARTSFVNLTNRRSTWYFNHKKTIVFSQLFYTVLIAVLLIIFKVKYTHTFIFVHLNMWVVGSVFPIIALLYYGTIRTKTSRFNLRRLGWLKPFVIAFVASGAICYFPVLFAQLSTLHTVVVPHFFLYFLSCFFFTLVIAIMFDIKDYAADDNQQLRTFVVKFGIRKTILFILLPLTFCGLITACCYMIFKDYSFSQIIINAIPYLLEGTLVLSLRHRKKIVYYLAVIDGLLLVKAMCGIASVIFL